MTILHVLVGLAGLAAITVGAFLLAPWLGYVVLGFALLLSQKAMTDA